MLLYFVMTRGHFACKGIGIFGFAVVLQVLGWPKEAKNENHV